MSINYTFSVGNMTDDPKISYTQSGKAKAEFTLALNRMKEGADFPRFIAWEKTAEILEKYAHKGSKLAVIGHIQTGSYEGKNGKVYTTDIVAERIEFCDRKQKDEGTQPADYVSEEFMSIPEGLQEELPFH